MILTEGRETQSGVSGAEDAPITQRASSPKQTASSSSLVFPSDELELEMARHAQVTVSQDPTRTEA